MTTDKKNITGKNPVRPLSHQEEELWQQVKKTVNPLFNDQQNLADMVATYSNETNIRTQTNSSVSNQPSRKSKQAVRSYQVPNYSPPISRPKQTTGTGNIDKRTSQKIYKGQLAIDGKIDLHGMTQIQAYGELIEFLSRNFAVGARIVLIITGKGRASGGVLKNSVPQWLQSAHMAPFVSAFKSAHNSHGGDGALYVRLRKNQEFNRGSK